MAHLRDQPQPREFSRTSVINDIMAITVLVRFIRCSPDYMEVNAWSLAPIEESAEDSALRNGKLPDLLSAPAVSPPPTTLRCSKPASADSPIVKLAWSDISRGMKREHPLVYRRVADARILASMESAL